MKYPVCMLAVLLVASCSAMTQSPERSKPNIIFILADDMGYGDVGAFNRDGKIKTPALDRLAAGGMRFTDAHTTSSVCTPTRYGIMTGRYNWRSTLKSGVLGGASPALIERERTTVASMLKASGYTTAYIGKWHLGWNFAKDDKGRIDFSKEVTHTPNDLGFDYAYGHCGSLDMAPYVYVENGRCTAIPTETTVNTGKYSWWRKGLTAPDFVHEDVTPNFFRRGIKFVKEKANGNKPFFLYLPLPSPHTPILPTEQWQGKSGLNPYGDFVMMVDDYIGQLLETVKQAGIEDNTLVLFATDNGCSPAAKIEELIAGGHYPNGIYRGHKADIFEGGHRIPFIAKWPNVIKAGTENPQTICTVDLFGTLADIVDYQIKDNEAEDSYSILPLLEGKEIKGDLREATVHHSINGSFAIRQGDWKLAMCPGSGGWSFPRPGQDKAELAKLPPVQLYNLKDDPSEQNNLQGKYPDKVKELKALLTKYVAEGRSTPGASQKNDGSTLWKQLWWMTE
jgi:arylsulfatase A-like enzyme